MANSTKIITLQSGLINLQLDFMDPLTAPPQKQKNFTRTTLGDNTNHYDVSGVFKRRWTMTTEVDLTAPQKTDLFSLYDLNIPITLIEDFLESSVSYTVFFENIDEKVRTFQGDIHYTLTLQEI